MLGPDVLLARDELPTRDGRVGEAREGIDYGLGSLDEDFVGAGRHAAAHPKTYVFERQSGAGWFRLVVQKRQEG